MKAAMFYGVGDVRWDEIDRPTPGSGEVVIEPAFNGVCGSDLHLIDDPEHSGFPLEYDEQGVMKPMRLGHEYSGTVTEIGEGVNSLAVGDRVAVFPGGYCGECANCARGLVALCTNLRAYVGGVGEAVLVEARHAYKLPDSVDLLHGALVEPMATGWQAVRLSQMAPESTALVLGAGPIGLGVFLALAAQGVENVLISEPNEARRVLAEDLGARTIDPTSASLPDAVAEMSGGRGVDALFDAAGNGPAFVSALELLTYQGRAVVVAIHMKPIELNAWALQPMQRTVIGSLAYSPEDFGQVIGAMAEGKYPTDGWVSVRPAGDLLDVIGDLKAGRGTKILLAVNDSPESP